MYAKAALAFLANLERNNTKEWFDAHRADYEKHLLEPGRAFVEAIGPRLTQLVPGVHAEPKVGGSIFRIHRDTRFSKDKTPFKTTWDCWFWVGEGRSRERPGFGVRIEARSAGVIGGQHVFTDAMLDGYRSRVLGDATRKTLEDAIRAVLAAGPYVLGEPALKRQPRGLAAEGRAADLLRYTGMWAGFDGKPPPELHTPAFVDWCMDHFTALSPLVRWLGDL